MGTTPSKEQERDALAQEQSKASGNKTVDNASLTEDESSSEEAKSRKKGPNDEKTPKSMNRGVASGTKLNSSGLVEIQEQAPRNIISDDEVQVNLAMADLMAYLQVVATNSQNLPMTRRDDPEVRKVVSAISPEEYARKSAAFIPADVRVIAGSFTKYGRVWDLPNSEEYDAVDGAQEPGRSYGGACCNAMLKVLYDAANEAADAAHDAAASDAIFDDDDDESLLSRNTGMDRTRTFDSLVLGTQPTTISWATLLRKMKAEVEEIEFCQAPLITSTRKFDLNKPFSLLPEGFDPQRNTMRSLLIGCNYNRIPGAELKASHDDVRSMKDYIVNVHGFPETKGNMTVLLDDGTHKPPTHANIVDSIKMLSEQSQPGDVVFIQFSGHGGRVLDPVEETKATSYDEIIAPCDYDVSGVIRDTLLFKILLAPMRYGVTVNMLIDTCDTGMVFDLPYAWSTKTDRRGAHPKMSVNDNFSFVRFLKVVKTLYESSTFTQLGKTVGSALNIREEETIQEESSVANNSVVSIEEAPSVPKPPPQQSAILKALAACTSPDNIAECIDKDANDKAPSEKKKSRSDAETRTLDTFEAGPQTLLEQVMSCGFMGPPGGDDSDDDDDTYHGRSTTAGESYEDDTIGETTTYDSITDDGYDHRHRRRDRNRSRRR